MGRLGILGRFPWAWLPPHCLEVNKPSLSGLGREEGSATEPPCSERTVSLPCLSPH